MCQQGSTFQARGTPTRIAFLTIFLFGTVLYIFYCTFLISALSVVKSNLPFTNLAGLLRVGTHQLVVASGTIVEATIKTSTSPLYKRAWQNILDGDPDSFASHYTDCALRALKKRHACLLEISEYMYEHSKNLQLVALTEEKYGRFSVGIAVADKSPLKDLFNVQLVRMKMTGILDKIMTKWRIEPPVSASTSVPAMSMGSMASAFVIMTIGALLALGVLAAEVAVWRRSGAAARERLGRLQDENTATTTQHTNGSEDKEYDDDDNNSDNNGNDGNGNEDIIA
ncbi:probable glutamate receptor [Penaeus vannamei]|uniref:probable glutamate receptor n=1 Tax=Penaeus vannamei TaxID=6689 RepID=UPI00387F9F16